MGGGSRGTPPDTGGRGAGVGAGREGGGLSAGCRALPAAAWRRAVTAGTTTAAASARAGPVAPPLGELPSSLNPSPMRATRSSDVPSATSADADNTPPLRERTLPPISPRLSHLFDRTSRRLLSHSAERLAASRGRALPLGLDRRDGSVEAAQRLRPSQQLQRLEQGWGNGPARDSHPDRAEGVLRLETEPVDEGRPQRGLDGGRRPAPEPGEGVPRRDDRR